GLTRDGRRVTWEWDEEAGRQGLARAVQFFDKHDGAHGGLVRCHFSPAQVDTCTPELLIEAKQRADATGRPFTLHTSQSVVEFNEMLQRHRTTPIAWLDEIGVLGENTVLGHAIIIGGSSWTNYPAGDVAIMAERGCSVAHAPWVFARRWAPADQAQIPADLQARGERMGPRLKQFDWAGRSADQPSPLRYREWA